MSQDPYFKDRNVQESRQHQVLAGILVFGGGGFAVGGMLGMVWLGAVGIVIGALLGIALTSVHDGRSIR